MIQRSQDRFREIYYISLYISLKYLCMCDCIGGDDYAEILILSNIFPHAKVATYPQ